ERGHPQPLAQGRARRAQARDAPARARGALRGRHRPHRHGRVHDLLPGRGPPCQGDGRADHRRPLIAPYTQRMDFWTSAIHAGQAPDEATGSITTPIYQTSTYVQEEVGLNKGYDYSRVGNPTRTALQECLASLENAEYGVAFSSGLGATTTL